VGFAEVFCALAVCPMMGAASRRALSERRIERWKMVCSFAGIVIVPLNNLVAADGLTKLLGPVCTDPNVILRGIRR
jgi:hypothetical protein